MKVAVLQWMNEQLLKMQWLQDLFSWLFKTAFGIDPNSLFFEPLVFFFYDVAKIFILLTVLIFISSYVQSFFPPERTRRILGRFKGIWANVIAALLGMVTPFCSCSSIPIFIGFTKAGLPVGVTFSFLISSPLVDLASVLLLASIFGWKIAVAYVIVGVIIAIIGGSLMSLFHMERYIEKFVMPDGSSNDSGNDGRQEKLTYKERIRYSFDQVSQIIRKVWPYILIGVGIGAIVHGFIPQSLIEAVLGADNPFSVILATFVGIPIYADIFGTLPIAEALLGKGVGIGTVLAFMMGVTALSLPSLIMIKRVVKMKLLVTFVVIVVTGIIIMGYSFNAFGFLFI